MRTQIEIVEKVRAEQNKFMSFAPELLVPVLAFEHAREFLKPEVTAEQWSPASQDPTAVIAEMRDYMAFGWGKVDNHRGLSAGRTVDKMRAWLWLLGDDEMRAFADDEGNYSQYGAPILKAICEKYGFPIPADPRLLRMMAGEPCGDGGCGCGE